MEYSVQFQMLYFNQSRSLSRNEVVHPEQPAGLVLIYQMVTSILKELSSELNAFFAGFRLNPESGWIILENELGHYCIRCDNSPLKGD